MKLGVGLIVKNEEKNLPKCLNSVKDVADVICIIDTGSDDNTEFVAREWAKENKKELIFEQYLHASQIDEGGHWYLVDWAKARNRYNQKLDKKVDYILSMDADDEIEDQIALKCLINAFNFDVFGIVVRWPEFKYVQHRLWKTKKGYKFKYPIFEYLDFPDATVLNSKVCVKTVSPTAKSSTRNLKILEREYANDPDNRILFYYGNTLRELGDYKKAIEVYRRYLANPITFWDEYMRVHIFLMRCLRVNGDVAKACAQGFIALSHDGRFSEVSMELAYMYYDSKDWGKASAMCYFSMQKTPDTTLFLELDKYTSEPVKILKMCLVHQMKEVKPRANKQLNKGEPNGKSQKDA